MRTLVSIAAVVFTLACIVLTATGQFWAFLLLVVVLGPIAFVRGHEKSPCVARSRSPLVAS
jgi:hypothetical protein